MHMHMNAHQLNERSWGAISQNYGKQTDGRINKHCKITIGIFLIMYGKAFTLNNLQQYI